LEAAFEGVFNRVLTELRLDWNNIGAQGTIAIAEALKVNAILTKLWLGGNYWGDAGGEAVRDAVKDWSGFVLMV
jgi:hypothetical protein